MTPKSLARLLAACCFLWGVRAEAYDLWAWMEARAASVSPPLAAAPSVKYTVETVAEGLESPWALAFTPDARLFVTERPGRLRVFANGTMASTPYTGVPEVSYRGQGGLLDIALHPDYARNRLLYLAYVAATDKGEMTRVTRFTDTGSGLADPVMIFPGFPGSDMSLHFGCRLLFGADGKLYVSLGERHERDRAQDLNDLNGKILRLNEDGSVPKDNPFVGVKGARPEIFSYGHRNPQGLALQPGSGRIFDTEHGPSWNDAPGGGDEVNLIEAGKNYGWPVIHHLETRQGMTAPLVEYTPAIAPSGCMFYTGAAFPAWKNDFFLATLVGRKLIRIKFDGVRPVEQEFLLDERFGRLRDVAGGPDGCLYVLTSNTDAYGSGMAGGDKLLRMCPAK